jgi:hypothetical protein
MQQTTTASTATTTPQQLAALTRWADAVLAKPAGGGTLLEQRHVLDEAAHFELTAAFRRLAPA